MPAPETKARILVAGGGIGGLVFALAARRKGFEVLVLERDVSAVRGEGRYIKFDTFTPAAERGLPVTRVISRMTLQQILARAVGDDAILNGSHVVDFTDDGSKVTAILEDGRIFEGDLLVGADGIWSKVRKTLFGHSDATYSGYTCYTGIADFVPPDIDTVGYRVFLGHKQYFVSSDVGAGKMQWYAFHKEEAGGTDPENGKKKRLLEIFDGWCDNVIDLVNATDEEAILRRDIYDRPPTINWGKGRVTLLGDSVHAMQPNLGQGGCMAIEDGYQLAVELENAWQESVKTGTPMDIVSSLRRYEKERRVRVAVIHGLARMAAIMATTYRPYLGVGLGPLSFLTKLRIPHPGRVGGRFFIKYGMPAMLSWVLGGNSSKLEGRPLSCRLSDKAHDELYRWFDDDDALEQAMGGEWYLFATSEANNNSLQQPIRLIRDEQRSLSVGSRSDANDSASSLSLPFPQISERHATITCKNKAFYLTDLGSEHGTWITDNEGRRYRVPPNFPVRFHPSDVIEFGSDKKAMFRVKVLNTLPYESARSGKQQGLQQEQVLQAA
ncbi:hypothetical protein Zm00014a_003241 [Zea mays]|uniref:Zeaxanthin epoxidase, chloroplastic n=1 Tax=Zea mays TaxID=4577 RepID=A0A3L6GF42_MAIZE|nr:Zeaxanthin epoxidase, chloroplastic [Zea mays]PWZ45896.1 hypothetical protein Zm00014a_003241 [Zea mays]